MKQLDDASPLLQRMDEALDAATAHVRRGGAPFAAAVIDAHGTVLGRGVNRVHEHCDPTAHAEIEAMRDACKATGRPHLSGLTLLATGEPCALCYLAAHYAGIHTIAFAASRSEAAAYGFDYRRTYAMLAVNPQRWDYPSAYQLPTTRAREPFMAFRARLAESTPHGG